MVRAFHAPLFLAVLAIPVAACSFSWGDGDQGIAPSGTGNTRTYAVDGFTTVGLVGGGDVDVRVGPSFSVTATGSPEMLDKIKVERDGKTLKLGWRQGLTWGGGDRVSYAVTMPRIVGADIGGSGSISVDRVEGDEFEGNIGGSGRLNLRAMQVGHAEFAIGGSGDIAAAGTARTLSVSIGGSGNVLAQPLRAETANVTIAGAGKVQATATRTADVTIMGSGDVVIAGGAKCSVTKMGGGKVRCG